MKPALWAAGSTSLPASARRNSRITRASSAARPSRSQVWASCGYTVPSNETRATRSVGRTGRAVVIVGGRPLLVAGCGVRRGAYEIDEVPVQAVVGRQLGVEGRGKQVALSR